MFFNSTIWGIAAVATLGMIARPWNSPEFVWAIAGATTLVLFNLLPWQEAVTAVGRGADVYLFLIGMMLLSEVARKEGCSTGSRPRRSRMRAGRPSDCS